ncbi:MAG: hypothetical protein ACLQVN_11640 [Bryobacteraceae bacterium]
MNDTSLLRKETVQPDAARPHPLKRGTAPRAGTLRRLNRARGLLLTAGQHPVALRPELEP